MDQVMSNNSELGVIFIPVVAIASFAILTSCLSVIFRMTTKTNHLVRVFYTTIATGAFGELFAVFAGYRVTVYEALIVVGVGMMFLFDRRSVSKSRIPLCDIPCECTKIKRGADHEAV